MRTTLCVAGALLLCTTAALGQENERQPPVAFDASAMEAMIKAGKPGVAHTKLDGLVGTWETKISVWIVPGAEPLTSNGVTESRWRLGGRYLEQHFNGDFAGIRFEGLGFTGYDNARQRYWASWMDNMSTGVILATGSAADDGKSWSFKATMADPLTGADVAVDETITITDHDHHVIEMWTPGPDGTKFKSMMIEYARRK